MRTTREEMQYIRKAAAVRVANMGQTSEATRRPDQPVNNATDASVNDAGASQAPVDTSHADRSQQGAAQAPPNGQGVTENATVQHRQPWEHVDEILQVLKTSFPLLILSLETMIDQIQHKFKLSPEEDIYRNVCMLLQDAVQVCLLRSCRMRN